MIPPGVHQGKIRNTFKYRPPAVRQHGGGWRHGCRGVPILLNE